MGLDTAQLAEVRRVFKGSLIGIWTSLDLDPAKLEQAAKNKNDRLKLAAQRVETYVGKLLGQQAQYVEVPIAVENVLRDKYDYDINPGAVSQVLLEAAKVRLASDSTAKAAQPGSVVPMPSQDTAKK
jgi:hypothetical protein